MISNRTFTIAGTIPVVRILLPLAVLLVCALAARWILDSTPEPDRRASEAALPLVDATRLSATDYTITLHSQGTVQPTESSTLVPEVAGSVVRLSERFVIGGFFSSGEVLVELDRRDLAIALTQSRANLAQARAQLQEEQALAQRAAEDWASLGRGGEPSSLTLRKPQMAAAEASLDAAAAEVERARLDLARTRLVAPYDGRVMDKSVDAGQFVNRGTAVGRIHALESVDIRLPLTNRQLAGLPSSRENAAPVALVAPVGGEEQRWQGRLVRVEGMDEATQQLTVVARVDNPYASSDSPLRIGQFVRARITGATLGDVFVIPRSALREGREVLVLDAEGRLQRRSVTVAWSDASMAAVSDGLEADEILVLTPLATVADGTPVRAVVDGEPLPLEPADA